MFSLIFQKRKKEKNFLFRMLITFIFLGFFSLLCIIGCGDDSTTNNLANVQTPPGSTAIAGIELSANPKICRVNGNTAITATAYDSEQNPVSAIKIDFISDKGSLSSATALTDKQGKALVIFTAGDTEGTATITATVGEIQEKLYVLVESLSLAGSIEYVSAQDTSQKELGVKGSGFPEILEVSFQVKDSLGDPIVDDTEVQFNLLGVGGDEYLSSNSGFTKNGFAGTYINSGTVSGTVAVIASVEVNDDKLETASRDFVIWGGPPDARHFSIGAEIYNIAGLVWNGKSTKIRVRLADQYGNPVPKDTVVYFATECGLITASAWINELGFGEATLISQNPRPDDGFVAVMAFTVGHESYIDINSDGIYNPNDDIFLPALYDLSEPYLDANMNCQYDVGELFWDEYPLFENENQWDLGNGQWDKKLFVWDSVQVLFSGFPAIWIYDKKPDISGFGRDNTNGGIPPIIWSEESFPDVNIVIPNDKSEDFYIVVTDDLGNPLTLDTKITIGLEEVSFDPNESACSFRISGDTDYTIKSPRPINTKKLFKVDVYNTSTQETGCVANLVVTVASTENGNEELRLKLLSNK